MKIYNYYKYKTVYFNLSSILVTIRIKFPVIGGFMFRVYKMYPFGREFGIHFFKLAIWVQLTKKY